ncbi:MAG: HNH endonuclease [Sandaracinaceae bacterium]|nr:HNH endonuclease [Sandaracinaceae bacterium]
MTIIPSLLTVGAASMTKTILYRGTRFETRDDGAVLRKCELCAEEQTLDSFPRGVVYTCKRCLRRPKEPRRARVILSKPDTLFQRRKRMSVMEYLKSRALESDSGCWIWQGALSFGYGKVMYKGRNVGAHRVAYMEHNAKDIPKGMQVCHSCDTPACINPAHLWLGTIQDNQADKIMKGRHANERTLTESQVREVRAIAATGIGPDRISAMTGIRAINIHNVLVRKTYKDVA